MDVSRTFRNEKQNLHLSQPRILPHSFENKSLFEQFDGIFADGSLLVSAIRLVYGKRVTRRSFDMTSLAPELLNYLMESRKTLYIVASGQEQVECSVRIFQEQYPELRIAGFRNGYFSSDAEMNKEASHIVELNPDFLIVGMGALMQEKFLLKVKRWVTKASALRVVALFTKRQ